MATIHVDGRSYEVEEGNNLLHACLSVGLDLPYFCWHPALGSVGACRQCAVTRYEDGDDDQGRLVMACMTPVQDGARISVEDEESQEFRAGVIEWLMVNHPHDCPICDEGGECHLQDMTVMTGHNYRRFRDKKRTHRNQDLGPFIHHEMNRCIACYRCVRFYRDHAGGDDLQALGAHHHVYFGRSEEGTLESEFSGNLVEVCPTGVFTDKTLKDHYTRKWDLQNAPSVCAHCGVGCNTLAGERYGMLRRILNRYHREVNGYFLCDRGRFGYEFVNSDRRVRWAYVREGEGKDETLQPLQAEDALDRLASKLGPDRTVLGIGSPRASLESNLALKRLVGAECFYPGLGNRELEQVRTTREAFCGPVPAASLQDVRSADAAFVLGEDPTDTAPMLALALRRTVEQAPKKIAEDLDIHLWHDDAVREAVQDEKGPLHLATYRATRLDDLARSTHFAAPDDLLRLAVAVARELGADVPEAPDLTDEERARAREIAGDLREAERPVVVAGTGSGDVRLLRAALAIGRALHRTNAAARICWTVPESNSLGAVLLGGQPLSDALQRVEHGDVDAVVVLENDLFRRAAPDQVEAFLEAVPEVIVLDHLEHGTAGRATGVLPAATFAEGDGTLVNYEGRAQRFYQVYVPDPEEGDARESWRWLGELALRAGRAESAWQNLDEITRALAEDSEDFSALPSVFPRADHRVAGRKISRAPHRYSGRTAEDAHRTVHEPEPPEDPDSPMSFSMEGAQGPDVLPELRPFYWAPGWNSVQALNKFQQEVGGRLRGGDPGWRLLRPEPNATVRTGLAGIPHPFEPADDALLLVPAPRIFGSEELSMAAPSVAQRSAPARLAVHPQDAEDRGWGDGETVRLTAGSVGFELPVELDDTLPRGVAAVPVGMPGLPHLGLPAEGREAE